MLGRTRPQAREAMVTVLVCDDQSDMVEEVTDILTSADIPWIEAACADAALKVMVERSDIDLVIAGVESKGGGCLDMLRRAREQLGRSCPAAVAIAGHSSLNQAVTALRLGVADFLIKPVDPDELLAAVRRVLASRAADRRERVALRQGAVFAAAFDAVDVAMLVLTPNASLLYATAKGEELLDANDPLVVSRSGRVTAARPAAAEDLRRLLAGAVAGKVGAVALDGSDGERRYSLLAVALAAHEEAGTPIALFLQEVGRPTRLSGNVLAAVYGLTRAEGRLAEALANGMSTAEAAGSFGISPLTARTQLKSIFAKTGTSRQADLVRLMLTGPARYAVDRRMLA